MYDMSPLGRLILKVMRIACLGAAALLAFFLALVFWQKTQALGLAGIIRQDIVFMAILAVMSLGALWLARAIGREMNNPGS
jgi:uncharacterized membrane protein